MTTLKPEDLEGLSFHLRPGAAEPEVCAHPSTCSLGPHAKGIEAAERLREQKPKATEWRWPAFTKADLPMLRESLRTGKSIIELREEGW
ncbi:hypothetical protein GCM10017576_23450 [Microbacterium barkeri]|uniref:Uncharacterized protein n=1 Tax=Microbacterium barkeri TaxID=33917 RepID=A0A9W6LXH3_9MICO|nr:hypothetical protein [Microbacterium barkeri]MDI6944202.1 hypothetical protein [Microbacterium barkeri]MDR6876774.1 hypothetical protein [Microbacterium barkeri]GLJ62215.1 hypothetical protein GCM10017576_23450 [Microbacterium barkeri]